MNSFFLVGRLSLGNKKRAIFNKKGVDLSRMFFKEFGDVVKGRTGERVTAKDVENVGSFSESKLEISSIAIKVEDFKSVLDFSKESFSVDCF